jgi:hypothetical protein
MERAMMLGVSLPSFPRKRESMLLLRERENGFPLARE